jgi:ribosomal protein S27E
MSSLLGKYRSAITHTHGWNVELSCSQCGFRGLPRYEGWIKNGVMHAGDKPTISVKIACRQCGRRLTDEAGGKLVELFNDVTIPEENRKIIKEFIAGIFLVPVLFALLLFAGTRMGWWGYSAFVILALSAAVIQPLVMLMNYRIALLRKRCDCGRPDYVFMGLLGRTYCYRCSSCGSLLRLRD